MKTFIYDDIKGLRGAHSILRKYISNTTDFVIVFTQPKDIEAFCEHAIVPIAMKEPFISFKLFKWAIIYNNIWAHTDGNDALSCRIEPQLSDNKTRLSVYVYWNKNDQSD